MQWWCFIDYEVAEIKYLHLIHKKEIESRSNQSLSKISMQLLLLDYDAEAYIVGGLPSVIGQAGVGR